MPEHPPDGPVPHLTRRRFLQGTSALALAVPLLPVSAGTAVARPLGLPGVTVRPREDWAGGLAPTGPLSTERPGDVRFLLVHHTASTNAYSADAVPAQIRGFYALHTGPTKRWPDVAYNFFVDRHGTVWEGRTGSLAGPVQPDATGGSQGFAQLCCFIGDHQTEAPTEEARRSMVGLLAALADVYALDTSPGATTSFLSRGSNRWPAGTTVTASTISGHRDMSLTSCPGDFAHALVRDEFPANVTALRAGRSATPPALPGPVPAPSPSPAAAPAAPTRTPSAPRPPEPPPVSAGPAGAGLTWPTPAVLASGGVLAAVAATGLAVRARLRQHPAAADSPVRGMPPGSRWRVHDAVGATGRPGAPGEAGEALTAGTLHESGRCSLFAGLVRSDRSSPAVRAALDGVRHGGREMDRQIERWQRDPARATAVLVSRAMSAGYAATPGRRPVLDVAVVSVMAGIVTVVTTDETMGALLGTDGAVRRPVHDRPSGPGSAFALYRASCPETQTVTVVVASPQPASSRGLPASERLPDLCRRLAGAPADGGRALANFRYDFFGVTGTDVAVLALAHGSPLPSPPSAPRRPS